MAIHRTASGYVELIGQPWRDGETPKAKPRAVACLTVHDDTINAVWTFTGKRRDAAETLGRIYVGTRERVAILEGNRLFIETPPHDLWKGKGAPNEDGEFDEFEIDTARYPNIIAY